MIAYYISENQFYVEGSYNDFSRGRKLKITFQGNLVKILTVAGYVVSEGNTTVTLKESELINPIVEVDLAVVSWKSHPDSDEQISPFQNISDRELAFYLLLESSHLKRCTYHLLDNTDRGSVSPYYPIIMNEENLPSWDPINLWYIFNQDNQYIQIDYPAVKGKSHNVFSVLALTTDQSNVTITYSIDNGVTWKSVISFTNIEISFTNIQLKIQRRAGIQDQVVVRSLGLLYDYIEDMTNNPENNPVSQIVFRDTITDKLVSLRVANMELFLSEYSE